jgi:hypothetical protein
MVPALRRMLHGLMTVPRGEAQLNGANLVIALHLQALWPRAALLHLFVRGVFACMQINLCRRVSGHQGAPPEAPHGPTSLCNTSALHVACSAADGASTADGAEEAQRANPPLCFVRFVPVKQDSMEQQHY